MMTILLKWFREKDKLQHIVAGMSIYLLISIEYWVWAWPCVVVAALGRETWGYFMGQKRFNFEDIGATLLGGAISWILLLAHYQNNL